MIPSAQHKLVWFILLTAFFPTYAQQIGQEPWLYIGGYAAYRNNFQSANFQSLPNAFRCGPNYMLGTGGVGSVGVLATYPMSWPILSELRFGYAPLSGRLFSNEIIGNTAEIGGANRTTQAESIHELFATLPALTLEPSIGVLLFHRFRFGFGLSLAYLLQHTFYQVETLTDPDYVFFLPDSSRQRNRTSGTIGNVHQIQHHLSFSMGVDFPLNSELLLTPEIRYYLPLVPVTRDVSWHIAPLSIGASVRRALYPPPPPIYHYDTVYVRDTSMVPVVGLERETIARLSATRSTTEQRQFHDKQEHVFISTTITEHYERRIPRAARLILDVFARPLNRDNTPLDSLSKVVIEETEVEESFPLLPYIFFTENSSNLELTSMQLLKPSDTAYFDDTRISPSTMGIYRHLLNIVGKRMHRYSTAKLTVTGTNSNVGIEAGNLQLSQARANAVRDYLIYTWGIDPARIAVRARNLPSAPSNNATMEGQEENRRAELSSTVPEILAPVTISSVTVSATPPLVEFVPTVESEVGVNQWTATIEQEGKVLRTLGNTNGEIIPYLWDVTTPPYPKLDEPVVVSYSVRDRTGQQVDKSIQLDVRQLTIRQKRFEQRDDKRIDRFSLIVFDFDQAQLTPAHRQLLEEVLSRIQPQSSLTIAGYADRTGIPEYNRELARRRCVEVQRALGLPDERVTILPIGSDELLYNNATPEGRSYCRTVQVVIETPLLNGTPR